MNKEIQKLLITETPFQVLKKALEPQLMGGWEKAPVSASPILTPLPGSTAIRVLG